MAEPQALFRIERVEGRRVFRLESHGAVLRFNRFSFACFGAIYQDIRKKGVEDLARIDLVREGKSLDYAVITKPVDDPVHLAEGFQTLTERRPPRFLDLPAWRFEVEDELHFHLAGDLYLPGRLWTECLQRWYIHARNHSLETAPLLAQQEEELDHLWRSLGEKTVGVERIMARDQIIGRINQEISQVVKKIPLPDPLFFKPLDKKYD